MCISINNGAFPNYLNALSAASYLVDDLFDVGLRDLDGVEQPGQLLLVRLVQLDDLHLLVVLPAREPERHIGFCEQSRVFTNSLSIKILKPSW